ncbi:Bax inhibitor-1/YccA family membrane protein [Candidatus Phytoplasma pruni]|uniref:Bax inhibitor-1/YccA family protein n=1 Tax=Candidatus Phytoplasma pruni TaxID=479893 RepID=A0A851HIK0_9MOLU|nr:Bax inhibitor-1/YccA family protein [Candidatus Phytoplasma pruni]NWN45653.1 Bax inhibitor-1/YccA family protein [Candidatus Phytoplasma pruni]
MYRKLYERLFNPSKNARIFLNREGKLKPKVQKRIHYLQKQNKVDKKVKTTTYKSVFTKFAILMMVLIASVFLTYFLSIKHCDLYDILHNGSIKIFDDETKKEELKNIFLYLLPICFFIIFFGSISIITLFVELGTYVYNRLLKYGLLLSSIFVGFLGGSNLFLLKMLAFFPIVRKEAIFTLILLFTSVMGTILTVFVLSFLYYSQKIKTNDKLSSLIISLLFLSWAMEMYFIIKRINYLNSDTIVASLIAIAFSILDFIIGALIWVLSLESLDHFIEQEMPQKFDWLIVNLLFTSIVLILFSIIEILSRIVSIFERLFGNICTKERI